MKRHLLFACSSLLLVLLLDHDNYSIRMAPHTHHNGRVTGIFFSPRSRTIIVIRRRRHTKEVGEAEGDHGPAETMIHWVVLLVNYFIMILIIQRIYNNSTSTTEPLFFLRGCSDSLQDCVSVQCRSQPSRSAPEADRNIGYRG